MKSPLPVDPVRRNRTKLLLLAALFALPLAAAWLAHEFQLGSGEAANYGELIGPWQVPDSTLTRDGKQPLKLSMLRGKWILLQFDAPACDSYCEKKLYYMRQIRRALGNDMERVERLWILTAEGAPKAGLVAAFEGTMVARSTDDLFESAFAEGGTRTDHIYLVDPLGNVMMRFPRDPDPSRMLKDLNRLLKYSSIG